MCAALLVSSLALGGCQSVGTDSGPVIPLLREVQASSATPPVTLGPPTIAPDARDVVRLSHSEEVAGNAGDGGEQAKGVPPVVVRRPDQILHACYTQEQVIDLAAVFRLANLANPTIGLAEETVRANLAEQMLARSLLFPTLNLGTTLSVHRGSHLSGRGAMRDVDRESLYFGAGSDVRGSGTLAVPGVHVVSHLGDAVMAPRVARQAVQASQFDAVATQNAVLLDVASAYLALVGAEARVMALQQSEREIADVARLTADFASKGLGREADAFRAQSELALLQSSADSAEEDVIAQATELARLLSTEPTVRLRPEAGTPPLIQLADERLGLEVLVQTALANRPEVAARETKVALFEARLRQERIRPLLPTVSVGVSAGDFGGGSDLVGYRFSHFNTRTDFDVLAVWTLQNFGLGNRAVQNKVRAEVGMADAQRTLVMDLVQREVTEAFSRVRSARHELDIAKRRVATSQRAFQQDLARTKDRLGNLIEVSSSFNQLTSARQDLVKAMVAYSQAQFQLHVAIGGTPVSPPQGIGGKD